MLTIVFDRSPYLRGSRRERLCERDSTTLCLFSAARVSFQKLSRQRLQAKLVMCTVLQEMDPCRMRQFQD